MLCHLVTTLYLFIWIFIFSLVLLPLSLPTATLFSVLAFANSLQQSVGPDMDTEYFPLSDIAPDKDWKQLGINPPLFGFFLGISN